jgi:hypothetical protein
MIPKQLAEFRKLIMRFNLVFRQSCRLAGRQYLFPGKSHGAEVSCVTGTTRHLSKGMNSLVSVPAGGPDLEGSLQKAKSLGVLAVVASFFYCLHATNASIPVAVGPVKKLGRFVQSITAPTEQFSSLLTQMPSS